MPAPSCSSAARACASARSRQDDREGPESRFECVDPIEEVLRDRYRRQLAGAEWPVPARRWNDSGWGFASRVLRRWRLGDELAIAHPSPSGSFDKSMDSRLRGNDDDVGPRPLSVIPARAGVHRNARVHREGSQKRDPADVVETVKANVGDLKLDKRSGRLRDRLSKSNNRSRLASTLPAFLRYPPLSPGFCRTVRSPSSHHLM